MFVWFLYVEVVNWSILLVSISSPGKVILLLMVISSVKLRTELCNGYKNKIK